MFEVIGLTSFIWLVAGIVLTVLEFVIPGVITIFFGLGALLTGILSIFLDISVNLQIFIFLGSSVVSLIVFRKYLKAVFVGFKKDSPDTTQNISEHVGKKAVAQSRIGPNIRGTVMYNGTVWEAESEDEIQEGDTVRITGLTSIVLQVVRAD